MISPYNNNYTPPMPVVEVFLAAPDATPNAGPFEAILDTGADGTVVPKEILLDLGAPSLTDARLISPWGEPHEVMIYLVDIRLGTTVLPAIQVAADESAEEIILGRNVLNKFPIFLDGPSQIIDFPDEVTIQRLRASRK
ncbi:MAG: retroviral-like aspartic protease family protein [Anaerolineales bacterium]|nr:retroviral-like aspartic protease family protein [Anaerolineales bacterium]